MFFQPAILALLLAGGLGLAALLLAAPATVQLVRRWDLSSASSLQIALERRTYLLATLVVFVLALQMAALLLFVFNADRMAAQFVGAMCAVGSLQANGWGFPALLAQILVFFLAAAWLVLHHADTRAPSYPLTRLKFTLLLAPLLPAVALSVGLQWLYFAKLEADVITSCCGSLFSAGADAVTGDLAGLPPRLAMALFGGALALAVGANVHYARRRRGAGWAALASALGFGAALAGMVSFVSLYIYEHPHHHCPFCILKPEYHWQGYALYLPLFAATAAGLGVGALGWAARRAPELRVVAPALARRLALLAAAGFGLFALLVLGAVWRSNLILLSP